MHRATQRFGLTLAAFVGLCVASATAQNNSMLTGGSEEAPPPQDNSAGTAGDRVIPMNGAAAARRAPRAETAPEVENPVIQAVSPFAVAPPEPREFAVGDIITIIVREIRESKSEADLKEEKEWTVESALEQFIRLDGDGNLIPQNFEEGTPGVSFNYADEWEGNGEAEREDSLTLRISASVIDIKPNGVLVLEAKKRIKVDEDEQITTLTGKCRTADVTATNTVLSTQLADAEIVTSNTGPVRDSSRRGWLRRLLDLLRPI